MCTHKTHLAVMVERLGHGSRIQLRERALRRRVEDYHFLDKESEKERAGTISCWDRKGMNGASAP